MWHTNAQHAIKTSNKIIKQRISKMKKLILPLLAFAFLFFIACGSDSTKATDSQSSLKACEVTGVFSTCFYTSSKSLISLIEEQCSLMEGTIISDCSAYPNCEASEGNKGVFSCEIK